MTTTLIGTFWFLLPAGFANMAPVICRKIEFLASSVDFGKHLWGRRLFGHSKTWRGFVVGIIFATFVLAIQQALYPLYLEYVGQTVIDYSVINIFLWGLILGGGALLGDLAFSFFKRRLGMEPGIPWPIADQLDWVIGALALSATAAALSFSIWISAVLIYGPLHLVVNRISYWIGLQKNKY